MTIARVSKHIPAEGEIDRASELVAKAQTLKKEIADRREALEETTRDLNDLLDWWDVLQIRDRDLLQRLDKIVSDAATLLD